MVFLVLGGGRAAGRRYRGGAGGRVLLGAGLTDAVPLGRVSGASPRGSGVLIGHIYDQVITLIPITVL